VVAYDRTHGGYGYYVGSRWAYYNALEDAAMLSSLMRRHNYYYNGYYNNGYGAAHAETVYVDAEMYVGIALTCIVLLIIVVAMVSSRRNSW
jgi:hypothetical protein